MIYTTQMFGWPVRSSGVVVACGVRRASWALERSRYSGQSGKKTTRSKETGPNTCPSRSHMRGRCHAHVVDKRTCLTVWETRRDLAVNPTHVFAWSGAWTERVKWTGCARFSEPGWIGWSVDASSHLVYSTVLYCWLSGSADWLSLQR